MNLLNSFSFELPTNIIYGPGVAGDLPRITREAEYESVLIVTDKGITDSGLLEKVTGPLEEDGIGFNIFDDVEPNPRDYNVNAGAEKAKEINADCLVAVGGGSPIDCAKAMAVLAVHGGKPRDYAGRGKIPGPVLPIIAVPTTAGSASEVTFSAVITDSKEKFKFSYRDTKIAPRFALADPEMTATMPPALTAATGMDALTHAIEGFTAKEANPFSDAAALHAIELINKYLRAAVENGGSIEARSGMLAGSILAGIAFSHSDVAAVHCIAEALGGMYDLPHGVCNAVVLPAMMEYNMDFCAGKYARAATAMGIIYKDEKEGARKAVEAVKQLARDVKLPEFKTLGVRESDFGTLAEKSFKNGSNASNPRPMEKSDYLNVFEKLAP
ncbi:MAG: iron-containing alcohol dehydrogenase [Planctomycetota bacterium]|nr:MAG: iron-containing alcohol dehydrogenase [Planctomycetota bacterium]